jgi:hypothetical protein
MGYWKVLFEKTDVVTSFFNVKFHVLGGLCGSVMLRLLWLELADAPTGSADCIFVSPP